MYMTWLMIAILLSMTFNTYALVGSKKITRCWSDRYDTPLCRYNQVSSITRVYFGISAGTSECNLSYVTADDCTVDLGKSTGEFRDIIARCNGSAACQQYVANTGWINNCPPGYETGNTHYQVIEYNCADVVEDTGSVQYVRIPAGATLDRALCATDKVISVISGYYVYSLIGSYHEPFGPGDCVDGYNKDKLKSQCVSKIACAIGVSRQYDKCSGSWTNLLWFDFIYVCFITTPAILFHKVNVDNYLSQPLCGLGARSRIKATYFVISVKSPPLDDVINTLDCISPEDESPYKERCDGRIACHNLFVTNKTILCRGSYRTAEYLLVLYTCEMSLLDQHVTSCPGQTSTISCPGYDHTIHVTDVLLGYSYSGTCDKVDTYDDLRHYDDVTGNTQQDMERTCNGSKSCQIHAPVSRDQHRYENWQQYSYFLVIYECLPDTGAMISTTEPLSSTIQTNSNTRKSDGGIGSAHDSTHDNSISTEDLVIYSVVPTVILILVVLVVAILIRNRRRKRNPDGRDVSTGEDHYGDQHLDVTNNRGATNEIETYMDDGDFGAYSMVKEHDAVDAQNREKDKPRATVKPAVTREISDDHAPCHDAYAQIDKTKKMSAKSKHSTDDAIVHKGNTKQTKTDITVKSSDAYSKGNVTDMNPEVTFDVYAQVDKRRNAKNETDLSTDYLEAHGTKTNEKIIDREDNNDVVHINMPNEADIKQNEGTVDVYAQVDKSKKATTDKFMYAQSNDRVDRRYKPLSIEENENKNTMYAEVSIGSRVESDMVHSSVEDAVISGSHGDIEGDGDVEYSVVRKPCANSDDTVIVDNMLYGTK